MLTVTSNTLPPLVYLNLKEFDNFILELTFVAPPNIVFYI